MTTLAKRATPSQTRILRIIEGAVLNTADAHKLERDEFIARSIAKRATGTLTAQWPEVLAANTRPPKSSTIANGLCRACERRKHILNKCVRSEHAKLLGGARGGYGPDRRARRELSQFNRRLPLLELWMRLKREMWQISRSGNIEKINAYRDLLRMINKLHRDLISADK